MISDSNSLSNAVYINESYSIVLSSKSLPVISELVRGTATNIACTFELGLGFRV